jgi:hypothetical protein
MLIFNLAISKSSLMNGWSKNPPCFSAIFCTTEINNNLILLAGKSFSGVFPFLLLLSREGTRTVLMRSPSEGVLSIFPVYSIGFLFFFHGTEYPGKTWWIFT